MKTSFTAAELMEVALMCIANSGPDEPERDFYCWTCCAHVKEADYAWHDRRNHILELEEPAA